MEHRKIITNRLPIKAIDGTRTADHVIEYTEQTLVKASGKNDEWINGMRSFVRESDRKALNLITESEFLVVTTGESVHV